MQKIAMLAGIAALGVVLPTFQTPSEVDYEGLKTMITGLGYEVKENKLEKGGFTYEFTEKTDEFNVPIMAEISESKRYIWLTVTLGDTPKDTAKHTNLLKHNANVQPAFFYISKANKLKLGLPIDNRGLTAAHLKRVIGLVVSGVTTTSEDWNVAGQPMFGR